MNAYTTIAHLSPCVEAAEWLKTQPDASTAWNNCQRGDWMMWILSKTAVDQQTSVALACRFARTALQYTNQTDNRPLAAIVVAETWLANPCEETRTAARVAAAAAARAAADVAAYAAAYAAAAAHAAADAAVHSAAYAAHAAAYAARAAADAAAYAYAVAYAVAYADAARAAADAATYAEQANIIREIIPVVAL